MHLKILCLLFFMLIPQTHCLQADERCKCGPAGFAVSAGDKAGDILKKCGPPFKKDRLPDKVAGYADNQGRPALKTISEEWWYYGQAGEVLKIFVLQNNTLVLIDRIDHKDR